MSKGRIILYWLLLLIPTGLIGTAVFQLLQHEQERIEQQARSAVRSRLETIADSLMLTVEDVQEQMTAALFDARGPGLEQTLIEWENNNPLIRHVFIWQPDTGLVIPRPESTASLEMRNFVQRYRRLFYGQARWRQYERETIEKKRTEKAVNRTGISDETTAGSDYDSTQRSTISPRRSLMDLAKGKLTESMSRAEPSDNVPTHATGWIPWYVENQMYMIGWVRLAESGLVYGVELEIMTLLSRLLSMFPPLSDVPGGMAFTLNDGHGRILHQVGAEVPESVKNPMTTVVLVPHLPHWQLSAYLIDEREQKSAVSGFILLSGLLLAIFVIAILSGGALLTWQALRNHKESLQKTSFVSNVSHELKTPLTSIRMYAELLNEGRVSDELKKKDYLRIIVEESQRLTRLVNNVLDFSRLEQGRKKYRLESIALIPLVEDVLESQRLRFETAQVGLFGSWSEDGVTAKADRDALEQVLINLLDNSLKYAASGQRVDVGIEVDHSGCRILVSDRGPGVPKSQRDKIFKKFHRVDDSLTAFQPGSGLGLSISLKLMRGMGGNLNYQARTGGGSRFIVFLPCGSLQDAY